MLAITCPSAVSFLVKNLRMTLTEGHAVLSSGRNLNCTAQANQSDCLALASDWGRLAGGVAGALSPLGKRGTDWRRGDTLEERGQTGGGTLFLPGVCPLSCCPQHRSGQPHHRGRGSRLEGHANRSGGWTRKTGRTGPQLSHPRVAYSWFRCRTRYELPRCRCPVSQNGPDLVATPSLKLRAIRDLPQDAELKRQALELNRACRFQSPGLASSTSPPPGEAGPGSPRSLATGSGRRKAKSLM